MNALITVTPSGTRYYLGSRRVTPETFHDAVAAARQRDAFLTRIDYPSGVIRHYQEIRP